MNGFWPYPRLIEKKVNFNRWCKFYAFKIYIKALLKFNNALCVKTSCQYAGSLSYLHQHGYYSTSWVIGYIGYLKWDISQVGLLDIQDQTTRF